MTNEERSAAFAALRDVVGSEPARVDFPNDRAGSKTPSGGVEKIAARIDAATSDGVRQLGRDERVAPQAVVLAAFACVLARWSKQKQIVIGALDEGIVAPVRVVVDDAARFVDVVRATAASLAAGQRSGIWSESVLDQGGERLFQILFSAREKGAVDAEIHLQLVEDNGEWRGHIAFDRALHDAATMERFARDLATFAEGAVARRTASVHALPLRSEEEHRAVAEWSAGPRIPTPKECVHELFEAQARRTPDAVAVELAGEHLTYAELDARANQLAHSLIERGVVVGDIVAVCMDRSLEMVVSLYAVLKAGAAYAPLDPTNPPARVRLLIEDLSSRVVLVDAAGAKAVEGTSSAVIAVDVAALGRWSSAKPNVPGDDARPAYVIYTSGSTGKPKGVVNVHAGLRNRLLWMQDAYRLDASDAILQKTPYTFDVSVWEFFWPLMFGARLVVAVPEGHKDPAYLATVIREKKITTAHFVPSMLTVFLEHDEASECTSLRRVICSGEALPRALQDRFFERLRACELHNLYGPTEASIDVSYWACERNDRPGEVPIGRPIWNTELHVVDEAGAPCPIGVAGELCIGGVGVARGYLRRAELTADRFVPDPFSSQPGARMYRTGDLARWRADGALEYLDRLDHQVKVRGLRIELGEIDVALAAAPGVRAGVSMVDTDAAGEKRLVAYVAPRTVDLLTVKAHLGARLPEYMVPTVFVTLDAVPLTASGKMDRKALPKPDVSTTTQAYVAPEGELEEAIVKMFAEVLGVERVGAIDDFLELGGHSLLAARIIGRLQRKVGVKLPLRAVFEARTPRALAQAASAIAAGDEDGPVARVDRSGPLPVSFAQSRIWFLDQFERGSATYNVPVVLRVEGPVDRALVERAVGMLVRRHETLRTTYVAVDGEPHQRIHTRVDVPLRFATASTKEHARAIVKEEIARPFDLEEGPVIRAALVRVNAEMHLLVICVHQIATDAWSSDLLVRELAEIYATLARGGEVALDTAPIDYADYAVWQRARFLAGGALAKQAEWWKAHLAGAPASLELPTDRPRPAVKQHAGAVVKFGFGEDLTKRVRRLCANQGVTPFMLLLAAYYGVLSRWSGQNDVVIGTPSPNRTLESVEPLVGLFRNVLALRARLGPEATFLDVVHEVKRTTLDVHAHQDIPFAKLVEDLGVPRDLSRTPLYQAMFSFEKRERQPLNFGDAVAVHEQSGLDVVKVDLGLAIEDDGTSFEGSVEYDIALFDETTMVRFARHFVTLLENALQRPFQRVVALPIIPDSERRLLDRWNSTRWDHGMPPVHQAIERRARETPQALAVAGAEMIDYGELNRRANRLARLFRRRGLATEDRVAIWLPRSVDGVVAQLASLKAGCTYVPIDPENPAERVRFILADARAAVVVSTRAICKNAEIGVPLVDLDAPTVKEELAREPDDDLDLPCSGGNAAYAIYTSGTTGRPKGAIVEHRNLSNLVAEKCRSCEIRPEDRVAYVVTPAFDSTMGEIWPTLAAGASLWVLADEIRQSPPDLVKWLAAKAITVAFLPTALVEASFDEDWSNVRLRLLTTGGQALRSRPRPNHRFRFVNEYGPTETAVYVSSTEITANDQGIPPIGRPNANTTIHILDPHGQRVPIGVVGELCVGGEQVARGYIDRPELTATKFVPDPFSSRAGARLYRTGDLARWRADGTLEYSGRVDDQIKIRGFRIEIGEIEAALVDIANVREAVVVARASEGGEKYIAAYVVAKPGATIDVRAIKKHLETTLPAYMIPAFIMVLDALPLTERGKVDRNALPLPDRRSTNEYVAPTTPLEERIAEVWRDVLGGDRIGMHDDFFALGGHSLLAASIVGRLQRKIGVKLPLRAVFEARTPRALALVASTLAASDEVGAVTRVDRKSLPLTSQEARLLFLHRLDPNAPTYNEMTAVRVRGAMDAGALTRAFARLEERHEALRTRYVDDGERPMRIVDAPGTPPAVAQLVATDTADAERQLRELARQPFALAEGRLWRPAVVELAGDHVVALALHHIVTDEWSSRVLLRDLGRLYVSERDGTPAELPERPFEYADWAAWREGEAASAVEADVAHFAKRLAGVEPLELPTDRPRRAQQSFEGEKKRWRLGRELRERLAALAHEEGTTLSVALFVAFAGVLHRYTRAERFALAMPLAGRTRGDLDEVVGFFVNTVAIDFDFSDRPTVRELLRRTREAMLDAHTHGEAPFERVVDAVVRGPRDLSRPPLCQVTFAPQPPEADIASFGNASAKPFAVDVGVAKFDLTLYATDRRDEILFELEYATALFDVETAARFTDHFRHFLESASACPDERVGVIPLMDAAERAAIAAWNRTDHLAATEATVHELIEAQVDRTPKAVAVEFDGRALTYEELDARANRIAADLRDRGVALEDRVAIEVERSENMVAAVLGVLKAGAAYVPIDTALPEDRKRFMKDDAGVALTLDDGAVARVCASTAVTSRPSHRVGSRNLAYVLYTSGSTGRPKGVMVDHGNVTNLVAAMKYEPGIEPGTTTLSLTTLSFDVSVAELVLPLACGAKVVIGSREAARDPKLVAALLASTGARVVGATPATWRMMVDAGWRPDEKMEIHTAGEALAPDLAASLLERGARLWNLYGPTEATVYASGTEVRAGDRITIGRPLRNVTLRVVDEHMDEVPVGVPGELCIGGAGVARGYLGRRELTAEKFVPDPFAKAPDARMYRTGDLARWRRSGEVEYLGRLDHQVKIRGFRIELGEIEAVLSGCEGVRGAAVLAREDAPGDKRLVAYVVADEHQDVEAVRRALRRFLPDYMIPAVFVRLDALPLTSTGKVDRRALPVPEIRSAVEYVAPRDPTEELLAGIFASVLGIARVGIHDDFFALGGHSLVATRIVNRTRGALGVELPVRLLFEQPTVARLAERVRSSQAATTAPPIARVDRSKPVPASFAQARLWFLDQFEGPSPTYNLPLVVRFDGALDVAALSAAIDEIVVRHETLRTTFVAIDGQPHQVVHPPSPVLMDRIEASSEEDATARVRDLASAPFDLANGPALRATLVRVRDDAHVLVLAMHHIATDGWSFGVLTRELTALYDTFRAGHEPAHHNSTLDYADYAVWQRERLEGGDTLARQVAYWHAQLRGAPAALELPTDHPRPAKKQHVGDIVRWSLPRAVAESIRQLCRRETLTPFMALFAGFSCVLSRWSQQRDVVIGTPIANRTHEQTESIVGFFVNTLPLRVRFAPQSTFADVLREVKDASLGAHAQQDVPFEKLVAELGVERDLSRTPVFQAAFAMQNTDEAARIDGSAFPVAKFDIELGVVERDDTFVCSIEYDVALFERATIRRLLEHYTTLLDHASRAPETAVVDLRLLSEAERRQLLVEWNDTRAPLAERGTMHAAFERQVARNPGAIALVETGDRRLTYGELDARANRVAQWLLARGLRPGQPVGVWLERSFELVATMLGIIKAGGVYVPLERRWPETRISTIASRLSMERLVVRSRSADAVTKLRSLAPSIRDVLYVDTELDGITSAPPPLAGRPEDIAYIIFTSGSTGEPKGVIVNHRAAVNLIDWVNETYGVGPADRLLFVTSPCFDLSIYDVFGVLAAGGSIRVATEDEVADANVLLRILAEEPITFWDSAPAVLMQLAPMFEKTDAALRLVFLSGDWVPVSLPDSIRAHYPRAKVIALGGATEATVWSNYYPIGKVDPTWRSIPYGRPITNAQYYVLDEMLEPCPIGVAGDLYIGGECLALGYTDPVLTAGKFVPDAFSGVAGARLYRTGDRARFFSDGNLEFLGRLDNQVKVRGYRIELGEVEAALRSHPSVAEALGHVRERTSREDKELLAYVVPRAGESVDIADLQRVARERLPEYMVPSAFMVLDKIPMTANGKVDRKALPAPDYTAAAKEYVAPRDATEEAVAAIIATVLGVERVGMHDDFFALGGHSLLATRVISRLRSVLEIDLPVRAIFENATVAQLAGRIRVATPTTVREQPFVRVDRSKPLPASFAQTRLWFLDQLEAGANATYNVPSVLRLEGAVDTGVLERALGDLVNRHETLRTTFVATDGTPYQVIAPSVDVRLSRANATSEEHAREIIAQEVHRPFDLANGPLLRSTLVRLRDDLHYLVICIHHIATDGWSNEIITRELFASYAAFAAGQPSPLTARPFDYADFAAWQRLSLKGEVLERQIAFWKEHLAGAPPALELPTDRTRPATKRYAGRVVDIVLPKAVADEVHALCRRESVTPFMVLLAAYQCVLSRWSGQNDVVVGTPIANRTRPELEGMVGFFVNTLALRTTFADDASFLDILRQVKQTALAAHSHQDVPFERLVDELKVTRDMSRTPIFQAMFVMQNIDMAVLAAPPLSIRDESAQLDISKFDISLAFAEHDGTFRGALEYDVALFDRSTMDRFAEQLVVFLDAASRDSTRRVTALPLLSEAEHARVVSAWNETPEQVKARDTVLTSFERSVARVPDTRAVVFGTSALTYAELDGRANALAAELEQAGVRPGDLVGLTAAPHLELPIALFGIWKAGAAYVPLDPKLPAQRLRELARHLAVVVAPRSRMLEIEGTKTIQIPNRTVRRAASPTAPSSAAYVLFTSGSTGTPKGVVVEHAQLSNYVEGVVQRCELDGGVYALASTFAADLGNTVLFPPFVLGGTLHILDDDVRREPELFRHYMAKHAIDFLKIVPSHFLALSGGEAGFPRKRLVFGGEAAKIDDVRAVLRARPRGCRVFNHYGPTETTVGVLTFDMDRIASEARQSVPLGRPLPGCRVYVLDRDGAPAPIGVYGELFIAGDQVSRGYLDDAAKSAERFVPDPFRPGARMYRTGDRCRWLASGDIEFAGRLDDQIKIRGFRVELGEIAAVARTCRGVRDAFALAHDLGPGGPALVLYIVGDATVDAVRAELAERLPEHMIPLAIIALPGLPLNANGKVDRKALPAPSFTAVVAEYVAPRDATEETLAAVFADVLDVERVGARDDFFALGGHSLLATRVAARLHPLFGEVPVREIFDAPTVAGLAEHLRRRAGTATPTPPAIARVARNAPIRASFAQTRLWFLEQLNGASSTYNVPVVVRLDGHLDVVALERALRAVVARHETLRTTFVAIAGEPYQVIKDAPAFDFEQLEAANEEEANAVVMRTIRRPFDIAAGPILRAALVKIAPDAHLFALTIHHIATDGWSGATIVRELSAAYGSFAAGRTWAPEPNRIDYADVAAWQLDWATSGALAEHVAFWKSTLAGAPTALELPTDRVRPATKRSEGSVVEFELPPHVTSAVRALARRLGATPFMVLLAAYQAVLSRWSRQKDIVVGAPIANRTRADVEDVVGIFINMLALRTSFDGAPTFIELVRRVKEQALAAYAHQELPFERLVDELGVARDMSRTPIFQAAFAVQNMAAKTFDLPGVVARERVTEFAAAKFDVDMALVERKTTFSGWFVYDVGLFERATAKRFVEHFTTLLTAATDAPETAVNALPLMPEHEAHRVLVELNATEQARSEAETVHGLFARQAARAPDAVALVFDTRRMTYGELDAASTRIAQWLLARGIGCGARVAISLPRNERLVAATLGVMKSGAAYVPVDPDYPADRREYTYEDARVAVVLDDAALAEALAWSGEEAPLPSVTAGHVAYVLYTSGSTGRPKGVMVHHGAVVNFLTSMQREPGCTRSDTMLAVTTLSFDIAGLELYLPLSVGATCVLASREHATDGQRLASLIEECGATIMQATPATWRMLFMFGWRPSKRLRVLCGGEALPPDVADILAKEAGSLWNMYGPTETTIWSTCIRLEPGQRITIGRPIGNTRIYIVDDAMQPVPIGVPGELCIAGDGVSLGYLGRPALSAERFVPDAFARAGGKRMYRTGDLARVLADGTIEYLGRLDHQVKVNGFRIELGEIEATLSKLRSVRDCAVIAHQDARGDKRLVAYVVPVSPKKWDAALVEAEIGKTLPDYMIPRVFITLEAMPLTTSGKIDRKALPAPELEAAAEYVAPRTPLEETVAEIFAKVLRVERVGVNDDFFALGGHSLLVMQAVAQLRTALDIPVEVRAVFEAPTVDRLAAKIASTSATDLVEPPPIVRTSTPSGSVVSYWQEAVLAWERLRRPSTTWNHCTSISLQGALDRDALRAAIRDVLARQESLRQLLHRDPSRKPSLCSADDVSIAFTDARASSDADVLRMVREETCAPFAFDGTPLARFHLVQRADDVHVLYACWHQIVHDAVDVQLLGREILEAFDGRVAGRTAALAPLPIRYVDYAVWERTWFEERGKPEVERARERVAGFRPLEVAVDRPRVDPPATAPVSGAFSLSEEDTARFAGLCTAARATFFMGAAAVVAVCLGRWAAAEDVVVLCPSNTRATRPELTEIVGRFGNWMPLRVPLQGDPTLLELFGRARQEATNAYSHANVPGRLVYDTLDVFDHPLARVIFNLIEFDAVGPPQQDQRRYGGVGASFADVGLPTQSRSELTLFFARQGGRFRGSIVGSSDLFDPATIQRWTSRLEQLFRTARLEAKISSL